MSPVFLHPPLPTHQPHHEVGEDGDPQSGGDEGDHEEPLPAGLATVGNGDTQEEDEGPGEHPLGLVPSGLCRKQRNKEVGEIKTLCYIPSYKRMPLM